MYVLITNMCFYRYTALLRSESRLCYRLRLLFFFFLIFPCKNMFLFFPRSLAFQSCASFMRTDRPRRLARAAVPFIARGLVTAARSPAYPSASPPVPQSVSSPIYPFAGRSGDVAIKIQLTRYRRREYSVVVRRSSWKVPFIVFFSFHVLLRFFFFCFSLSLLDAFGFFVSYEET